jgi:uncharacterized protein YndB with AHSA1/START domain
MTSDPADLDQLDPKLDLVLQRVVDVTPKRVWSAWTVPDKLMKWFCPSPWTTVACEIDLRPGGIFRTVMRSPEGQDQPPGIGCYLEVVENRRLVWTAALEPGYRPRGTWTAIASPADALPGGAVDSTQPRLSVYQERPVLAWSESGQIRVASWNGASWDLLGGALGSGTPAAYAPQLDGRNDRLHVGYIQLPSGGGSYYSIYIYRWTGSGWNAVGMPVSQGLTYLPDLALVVDSTGHPIISWTAQIGGTGGTAPRRPSTSRAGTAAAGARSSERRSPPSPAPPTRPTPLSPLTTDGIDTPFVVWTEPDSSASGAVTRLYVARISGGSWSLVGQPLALPSGFRSLASATIAIDGNDVAMVAFSGERDSDSKHRIFVYLYL